MSTLLLRNSKSFAYDCLPISWLEIESRSEKLLLSTVRWNLGPCGIWGIKLIKHWEVLFISSITSWLHLYSRHYRWQSKLNLSLLLFSILGESHNRFYGHKTYHEEKYNVHFYLDRHSVVITYMCVLSSWSMQHFWDNLPLEGGIILIYSFGEHAQLIINSWYSVYSHFKLSSLRLSLCPNFWSLTELVNPTSSSRRAQQLQLLRVNISGSQ